MDAAKIAADRSDAAAASAPVSPKNEEPANGRKTPEMDAAAGPSASAAVCTASRPRKRHASNDVVVDLRTALRLIRVPRGGGRTPLGALEKKVCCHFQVEQVGWNHFLVNLHGTEVGLRKGRAMLTELIENDEQLGVKKRREADAPDGFPFMRLPAEIQEMILARVDNVDPRYGRQDGRGLLPLRLVDRHTKRLADKLLTKGPHRCFKQQLYLGEALKGPIRLPFPPLISTVSVGLEQVDALLAMVTCTPPVDAEVKGLTEIGLKCDYRFSWCKQMMGLLLKHTHLQPDCLTVRGVLCEERLFRKFVHSRPTLKALIFEKPTGQKRVYDQARYLPYQTVAFHDLGRQFEGPESVRKGYNLRYVYSRAAGFQDDGAQLNF
ncbi:hypothetical protein M3Y99_00697800 [Aphelenchoides fujianensis]|nr:hypothetical protein M3Y99_00697800 [Aphelenchoides fujianensis]